MKQGTKQRIVGTIVLLALALIFLPIIFDGEGSYQTPLSSRIPDPPVITLLPDPAPVRPVLAIENSAAAVLPEDLAEPAAEVADPETPEIPVESVAEVVTSEPVFSREVPDLDPNGLPQGWSVRLGSFADATNASNLLQRLLSADYRAYTRPMPGSGEPMIAVFVGPWLERELAADYQKQLQDEFQLSGLVVRFEVEPLQD